MDLFFSSCWGYRFFWFRLVMLGPGGFGILVVGRMRGCVLILGIKSGTTHWQDVSGIARILS